MRIQPLPVRKLKKPAKAARPSRNRKGKIEREKRAFSLFLQQAPDFRLALALYNDVVARDEMIREIASKMDAVGRRVLVLDLRKPSEERSLLSRVAEVVKTAPEGESFAVMVINLESCVDYSPELSQPSSPGTAFLETANLHRDLFPQTCPAPLVFWMTELMERAFIRHAPDLWHWRSHVFDLRTRTVMRLETKDQKDPRPFPSHDERLHPAQRLQHLEEELAAYRKVGDRFQEMRTLSAIGNAREDIGDLQRARQDYEEVLRIAQQLGDRRWEGYALGNLGNVCVNSEPQQAIGFYEQSLAIVRELGDRRVEGGLLCNLGEAYRELGEPQKAIDFYEQSLGIARDVGNRRTEGYALANMGIAYSVLGEPRKAIEFYEQGLRVTRELSDRRTEANTLGNLGNVYATLGELPKAIELHEQKLSIARDMGDLRGEGTALYNLAADYARLRDYKMAAEFGKQSLAIHQETGDPWAERVRKAVDNWKRRSQTGANK